ncbi:GIY-YIG nuclease family protein [Herbaspirillum lusitanum]|uniref:GIY-YIG nuclease family protein n=1 Tax=Herbaspirillum lusitanum TaxID=213312 RepID=A0ABW9AGF5_9BURK
MQELKTDESFKQAGIYILIGNVSEETIYIGEADPVGERLKNHVANKEGWDWGVYFVDKNHKIGKTEVQFLEYELLQKAKTYGRAILLNKNSPTAPSMSPVAKATVQAFLSDILLILPMLGINAFSVPKAAGLKASLQAENIEELDSGAFDTVVVPAREEGFNKRFLAENCWFAIRIGAHQISKLKYIAAYQVAPVSAVTHVAEIASISSYENTGKFLLTFKGKAKKIEAIYRGDYSNVNMQSPRYAQIDKLLKAKTLDEIWA